MQLNRNDITKHYIDVIEDIHKESAFSSMLEFFQHGFTLTDDDRYKDFRLELSPWIKCLCEWFDDPDTDWIYILQGSQTSKTTFMMGSLLYVSQYVRGACPGTWILHVEDEARLFITERLKPFLDEAGMENVRGQRWKQQAFRVFNAAIKIGYASTKPTMRSKPARFVWGDECGIWKEPISYLKKRTRTFAGRRKGIFATTPPESGEHHSWQEATAGNFYQWHVPCPECDKHQGLSFANLEFEGRNSGGNWDFERVRDSARYKCGHCGALWQEQQKLELIQRGRAACVDHSTYKPIPEKKSDSKTLQVSALYSVFTTWGQLAVDFLAAKLSSPEALRIFFTDELAEIPRQTGDSLKAHELTRYKAPRSRGDHSGYQFFTGGTDVQRTGNLFWVIVGWKSGAMVSGHIIQYGKTGWKDARGNPDWKPFMVDLAPFHGMLYKCPVDATDGVEQQNIIDFCHWAGQPFLPLIDRGTRQSSKIQMKPVELEARNSRARKYSLQMMSINSAMVKDDIASAMERAPGDAAAWSFPRDTCEDFFRHMTNEHRVSRRVGGRNVVGWEPKYHHAPQHWFSALVYATAAMEEQRFRLQTTQAQESSGSKPQRMRRMRGKASIWR